MTATLMTTNMAYSQADKSIRTEIIINASAAQVWAVLINLSAWEQWNPFIVKGEGIIEAGKKITTTMINGDKSYVFKPKIHQVETNKSFSWMGHLYIPGLFDGHHYFELEAISPNQTRFIQGERFKGILSGMILKKIGDQTAENFARMNQALKQQVERS